MHLKLMILIYKNITTSFLNFSSKFLFMYLKCYSSFFEICFLNWFEMYYLDGWFLVPTWCLISTWICIGVTSNKNHLWTNIDQRLQISYDSVYVKKVCIAVKNIHGRIMKKYLHWTEKAHAIMTIHSSWTYKTKYHMKKILHLITLYFSGENLQHLR